MDLIESIKKDKAYMKCKLIVKNWEKDFKTQYSRTPSKFDIKEAPSGIRYAYKKYFQLKSAALENSLAICEIDDDFIATPDPLTIKPLEINSYDTPSPQSEELLHSLPSGQELEQLLSKTRAVNETKPISPFTENLSKKLFQNRKFSLRNPRKISLSKSIIEITNDNTKENDIDSDLTITCVTIDNSSNPFLARNHKFSNNDISVTNNFDLSVQKGIPATTTVRHLDAEWLERATGITAQEHGVDKAGNISTATHDNCTSKFGLRYMNTSNIKDNGGDVVENSESDEDNITLNKLKPALKKRRIQSNNDNRELSRHKEPCENYMKSTATENGQKIDYSNHVHNSQNSMINSDKNKKKKSAKEDIKDERPPDILEYVPFKPEKDIAPRHSQLSDVLKRIETTTKSNISKDIIDNSVIDKMEIKVKSGTLNDNFVKINIEKKVFVRGKKGLNFSKYKKQQWKDKKALHAGMEFPESGKITCFKCGSTGHMARYCTSHKGVALLPLDSINDNELPSLEDMKKIASDESNKPKSITEQLSMTLFEPSQIPDYFLKMLAETSQSDINPIYSIDQQTTPGEVYETLNKFGYETFRSGQEQAIMRILKGMSTLLILSTGGGKSLCYQIPAYIYSAHYKCITLVISPLVSLMEDQVLNMPDFLKAGCLHTNQPPTHRRKIIQCLKDGEINVLLISPEALISGDASNGFNGLFKSLPPIAFACIDEAHCVSHWSHNFRPSYLMICRVLREKLNVKCILGLTATASISTIKSVISHINIPDGQLGVITNPTLPDNLCLSVSFEKDKDKALVSFIMSERIKSFNSIIVYCIRRDECERIAAVLRSCLQESGKCDMEQQSKKRKRMSYTAEAYHAGMSPAQRKKIQKHFMDGILRIIVATVAFGMGINKSDIRCIIHYNMPSSFESYVQEVGRAGRDGKPAVCHVFMNKSNNDKNELLKHIHANSIDRPTIRKLLQKVFVPCECSKQEITEQNDSYNNCKGHEVGIPVDSTVEELDLPSENIATLLCYVELNPKQYIHLLNNAYVMCKISSYGGPLKIVESAKSCRPLAMAYLLESKKDPDIIKSSILVFNVMEVAAAIGLESGITKYQLKNLEWTTENNISRRSLLKVEFNTLGFRIKSRGDLSETQLDEILDDLHKTVITQEKASLYQLEESSKAFSKLGIFSAESSDWTESVLVQTSNELKQIIGNYFQREDHLSENIILGERPLDSERIICDVRALISTYKDCTFTGRSIARIFQGISSPNYPAIVWGRCKFWRSHIHEDFHGICRVATQQIIQMKV